MAYWGLYCEQCGVWWSDSNSDCLVHYSAPEIANAHLNDKRWVVRGPVHLWKVTEFGKEEFIQPSSLSFGFPLCPVKSAQGKAPIYA